MEVRVPVTHADIDREARPLTFEQRLQGAGLAKGDLVERRTAVKQFVVMDYLYESLWRYRSAFKRVGQKRPHVYPLLWTAKGDQQYRIVCHRRELQKKNRGRLTLNLEP